MSCVQEQYDDVWRTRNSGSDVIKLNATSSFLYFDGDDVEQSVRVGTCKQTLGPM